MELLYTIFAREEGRTVKVIQAAEVEYSERLKRPHAVTAFLPYEAQDNGLPAKGELQRLGKLEDQIEEALRPLGAIRAGHVNGNGAMRIVFYSRTAGPASVTVKAGLLKKETIALESRLDPEWSLFELDLEPTAIERHRSRFHTLHQTLAKHGDMFEKTRPVDFAARFPTEAARNFFMSEVRVRGFEPSAKPTWEPAPDDFWCELVKQTPIEPNIIAPESVYLEEVARKHGGDFDGWACTVTN